MKYINRNIESTLQGMIAAADPHKDVLLVEGARQVGKTTLAQMITKQWPEKTLYFDLERPTDYSTLNEPDFFYLVTTDL